MKIFLNKKLLKASAEGHAGDVARYLKAGADVNAQDKSGLAPLHHFVSKGHKNLVELAIANGADVNANDRNGMTPLHYATSEVRMDVPPGDYLAVAKLLIDRGADVNARTASGRTPLHCAAIEGHEDRAELLIGAGADIGAKDGDGCTPLHEAAKSGTVALASLFYVYRGANETDAAKLISAFLAQGENHRRTAEMLIDRGADVNAQDSHGDRPLHFAAQTGWKVLAGLLIARGAEVNAKGKDGRTALHCAAEKVNTRFYDVNKVNYNGMVELLIEKGAEVNAADSSGRTPLSLAAGAPHKDMADLLKKHGASE